MSDADAERTLGHKSREAWAGLRPCSRSWPRLPGRHPSSSTKKDVNGKWGHASPSWPRQRLRWPQVRIKWSVRAIIKLMPSYDSTRRDFPKKKDQKEKWALNVFVDNLFMVNRTRPHYHMSCRHKYATKSAVKPTHLAPTERERYIWKDIYMKETESEGGISSIDTFGTKWLSGFWFAFIFNKSSRNGNSSETVPAKMWMTRFLFKC